MKEENIGVLMAGERFSFKDFEWIVFNNNVEGGVLAIMASAWHDKKYCFDEDGCNNYAKSSLRRKLLNELLPVLGEDNLIPHDINLATDNEVDSYGKIDGDKVFILSYNDHRKYCKYIPLFHEWMWTCTPLYISNNDDDYHVCIVDDKFLSDDTAYKNYGVAPACVFNPKNLKLHRQVQMVEVKGEDY